MPYKDPERKRQWERDHRSEHNASFLKSVEERRELIRKEEEYYSGKVLGCNPFTSSEVSRILKRPTGKHRRQRLGISTHQEIHEEPSREELKDAGQLYLP